MHWRHENQREKDTDLLISNLGTIYGEEPVNALEHVLSILSKKEFEAVRSTVALECKLIVADRKRIKTAEATNGK